MTDRLVYHVKVPWKNVIEFCKKIKQKKHAGFYVEVEDLGTADIYDKERQVLVKRKNYAEIKVYKIMSETK